MAVVAEKSAVARLNNYVHRLKYYKPSGGEPATIANWILKTSGYDDSENINIFISRADVIRLVDRAEIEITDLEDPNKHFYLGAIKKVRNNFKTNDVQGAIGNFLQRFDNETIARLEMAANALSERIDSFELGVDQLEEIISKVEELSTAIRNSTIHQDLQKHMLQRLEEIRLAAINYSIVGPEGLRRAAEINLGFLFSNAGEVVKSSDANKKNWKEYIWFILDVFKAVKIAIDIYELSGGDFPKLVSSQ